MKISDFIQLFAQLFQTNLTVKGYTFAQKVDACRQLLSNDTSGYIYSIIKFAINAAVKTPFKIFTGTPSLDDTLHRALNNLNLQYVGKLNVGINPIKRDFFKSYWESGLVAVKTIWNDINGLNLPVNMFVLDSKNVEIDGDPSTFGTYSYSIGDKQIRDNDSNHLFVYKNSSMYEKYPNPPLISRGVYINYKIKEQIKNLQHNYLQNVVSMLWMILKGEKTRPDLKYDKSDFEDIKNQFQKLLQNTVWNTTLEKKIPLLVSSFDTQTQILTPEMEKMLRQTITEAVDTDILSGLGFITVIEGLTRKRSTMGLNPKPFISSVVDTVELFKQFLKDLVMVTAMKNKDHFKYFGNLDFKISASPIKYFWDYTTKGIMQTLSDRGLLSIKTSLENFDMDYEEELERREKEITSGAEITFFPRVINNQEVTQSSEELEHLNKENIQSQSNNDNTKVSKSMDYKYSSEYLTFLEHFSPYTSWNKIPLKMRKTLKVIKSPQLRKAWLDAFNNSYVYYKDVDPKKADIIAIKTAWKVVKLMGTKTEKGWILKKKYKKS